MGQLLAALGPAAGTAASAGAGMAATGAAAGGAAAGGSTGGIAGMLNSPTLGKIGTALTQAGGQKVEPMPFNDPGIRGTKSFAQILPELLGSIGMNYLGRMGG